VDKAYWLEVSLDVDGEMAEALAAMLSEHFVNGVVIETPVIFDEAEETYIPAGNVRVFGYMAIDDQLEEKRQKLLQSLYFMGRIRELPEPVFRKIEDENWMEAWKKNYHPIRLGERILILPAWISEEDPQRIAIRIDPSMAFGTGTHPSTQLCLVLLEKYLQPGMNVIDLGCGSGILSIAAAKLGASIVLAVDTDEDAVKASFDNGATNQVLEKLDIHLGSLPEITAGEYSIANAQLVVANILTPVILNLFNEGLSDIVDTGGILLLAGILEDQALKIQESAEAHGLKKIDFMQQYDWVALAFQKLPAG
jgi:ribosomal protein L11 methyltransferase